MNRGYIKSWRKYVDWEYFGDAQMVQLWDYITHVANWEPKIWHGIEIPRGSFVTTYKKMMLITNQSLQSLKTRLKKLEDAKQITRKATNQYTIITVCNFEIYQSETTREQQTNNKPINKPTTREQQTNNKPLTTTKNNRIIEDRIKEDKKENYTHTAREQKIFLKFLGIVNDFTEADRLTSEFQTHNANKTDEWWEKGLWENHISGFVENDRNFKKEKSCGKKEKAKPRYTYQEFCEAITNKQNPRKQSDFEHIIDSEGKHWWVLKE